MILIQGEEFRVEEGAAVAVGNFDGLHRGHIRVLDALLKIGRDRGLLTAVLSFFPHPAGYFNGGDYKTLLTTREKERLLGEMGIDIFVEYPFNEKTVSMPPEDFAVNILCGRLNARAVTVGQDFRFGAKAAGNADLLRKIGETHGFTLQTLSPARARESGELLGKISSSMIKKLILNRDIEEANAYLGREYFVTIDAGTAMGSVFELPGDKILPPNGVYRVTINNNGLIYNNGTAELSNGSIALAPEGASLRGNIIVSFIRSV